MPRSIRIASPPDDASAGERWAITTISMLLWMLSVDQRMTVLLTMIGDELMELIEQGEDINHVLDQFVNSVEIGIQQRRILHGG